jgi:hypothetical protein
VEVRRKAPRVAETITVPAGQARVLEMKPFLAVSREWGRANDDDALFAGWGSRIRSGMHEGTDVVNELPELLRRFGIVIGRHLTPVSTLALVHDVEEFAVSELGLSGRIAPIMQVHVDVPGFEALSVAVHTVADNAVGTPISSLALIDRSGSSRNRILQFGDFGRYFELRRRLGSATQQDERDDCKTKQGAYGGSPFGTQLSNRLMSALTVTLS